MIFPLNFHLARRFLRLEPVALDYRHLFQNLAEYQANAAKRQVNVDWEGLQSTHARLKALNQQLHQLQSQRRKAARTPDGTVEMAEAEGVRERIAALRRERDAVEQRLYDLSISLPNLTWEGCSAENQVLQQLGSQSTSHERLDTNLVDFTAGVRSTGSQFYFLRGGMALLHQALVQYAVSMAISHGYEPLIPPDLVQAKWIRACGFNPRQQGAGLPIYRVQADEDDGKGDLALTGTAEVPLAAYYAGETLEMQPVKWVAVGHAFRPEVGHSGAESRGLYRVHQFTKVELFQIRPPEPDMRAFEELVALQLSILAPLGLCLRQLEMAYHELGSSAFRKHDLEGWLPHSQRWGELTSASHCLDYQSRRLGIRLRNGDYPHTLNGTAMAVPRVMMALMEQHARAGTLHLPDCLHPHMLDGSRTIDLQSQGGHKSSLC